MIKAFLSSFMSAVSNCSLYSGEHYSVDEFTGKAFSLVTALLKESGRLELMIVEDDLIINRAPVKDKGIQGSNLLRRLKKKGITRVDFLQGLTHSELKELIAKIAAAHEAVISFPHIKTGFVEVRAGGLQVDADLVREMENLSGFLRSQIEKVKDIQRGISHFRRLHTAGIEEIAARFVFSLRRGANILKLILPVKSSGEYAGIHAANVAVLTMFQASALGVRDDLLRDIGVAALLHDVGKLFISKEVLEKKDAFNESDWGEMRRHPVLGAKYLAKIEGLSGLAAITSMEHHRRFDGTGYPVSAIAGRGQHFCSQAVAISDYFDALRSGMPYRRALDIEETLFLMERESGGAFNPELLNNFARSIRGALSG